MKFLFPITQVQVPGPFPRGITGLGYIPNRARHDPYSIGWVVKTLFQNKQSMYNGICISENVL